ncbi:MAG TPA: DUF1501 domain-containing protein [Burkholderiales bacterium]
MKRRAFLVLPFLLPSAKLFAAPSTSARFLLVFLRGGYDAANVLIPHSSEYYFQVRPNIAVPRDALIMIDSDWALHPALRESMYALWLRGEAAFVPFAGSHDLSRSHFESQDTIELGQPLGGARGYDSGFLGRLAAVLGASHPIAFTNNVPIAFRGPMPEGAKPVANVALGRAGVKPAVDSRQSALIAEMYRDTQLGTPVSEGFATRESVMRDLGSEMEAAGRNAINARGFELQARRIARLMSSEFNLGFVDVGGWDTHVGEGGANGQLATRLEELGRGLAAFADGMGSAWRDTVVVVLSEFGRTFRENGNRGTDHGHGSVYWVLGGSLKGQRVVGEQARVSQGTLFQDRDYPVLNEYRELLAGLFARTYGLDGAQLARVFPSVSPKDVALL